MNGDGWKTPKLESSYPSEDCGCPVEEWVYLGISLNLHFEEDGALELFADTGDWQQEIALEGKTMEEARKEAFAWCDALPVEA